jgi:endonuclease YncB( thermonuclease family)
MEKAIEFSRAAWRRGMRPWVPVLILVAGIVLLAHLQRISPPAPLPEQTRRGPSAFMVVDGDTVKSPAGVTYRLIDFDAPETFRAQCSDELIRGLKAKERLEQLIASGEARIVENGKRDKYRRTLAALTIDGRDVAATRSARDLPVHIMASADRAGAKGSRTYT